MWFGAWDLFIAMPHFPASLQNLINEFTLLPGVGRKTAERYVFFLLKQPKRDLESLANAITTLHNNMFVCPDCGNFTEKNAKCGICSSPHRDHTTICVIEETHDLNIIESTHDYNGVYHVLGGTLNPIDGITEDKLSIQKLINRITAENITEVILALNPDMPGEATMLYLKKLLQQFPVKVTRLARGLPMGSDLEYADEVTVSNALRGRKEI